MREEKPGVDPKMWKGCLWAGILSIPLYIVIIAVVVLIIKALTGW